MQENVILVDQNDQEVGQCEKIEAHEKALLHRAFSVFIFNKKGETLLHKRYSGKYHSGGLWTNACCGHPRPGENVVEAAERRLNEEMGFTCSLKENFSITYKAPFDNGLTEHEYVHIVSGIYEGPIDPNPMEVEDYKWIHLEDIKKEVDNHAPFTKWFEIYFTQHWDKMNRLMKVGS